MKVQLLHMLAVGPQAKMSPSLSLFIYILIVSLTLWVL